MATTPATSPAGAWPARFLRILRRPSAQRVLVAGPLALIAAIAVMAAMPHWVPEGAGRVDNLVFPVLGFPLIWATIFFYACLAEKPLIAAGVLACVIAVQVAIIGISLSLAA